MAAPPAVVGAGAAGPSPAAPAPPAGPPSRSWADGDRLGAWTVLRTIAGAKRQRMGGRRLALARARADAPPPSPAGPSSAVLEARNADGVHAALKVGG